MRNTTLIVLSIGVLLALNLAIYEKEQIKRHGKVLLLELTPVDPRSLMQGDYMRLRYAIENTASKHIGKVENKRGYMVIRIGKNRIGEFSRFKNNEQLKPDEELFRYYRKDNSVKIVPNSFLFQEKHGKYYDDAKYGVFKFDDSGNYILVGLAGKNFRIIKPVEVETSPGA